MIEIQTEKNYTHTRIQHHNNQSKVAGRNDDENKENKINL